MGFTGKRLAALAALVVPALVPLAALADMVVIASTAPGIERGQQIAAGTRLDLPEGAQVTLLSVDGSVVTIESPGGIAGSQEAGPASTGVFDTMKRLIEQSENLGNVGAVRSGGSAKCLGIDDLLELLEKGCEREAAQRIQELAKDVRPSLFVGAQKPGSRPAFGLGETIDITVQANFDAYVYCFHEGSDGTTTRLVPITGEPPKLAANQPANLAGDLGKFGTLVAGDPVGVDRLECFASEQNLALVEPDIFSGSPSLGVGQLDGAVRHSFSDLASERSAVAGIELEILD